MKERWRISCFSVIFNFLPNITRSVLMLCLFNIFITIISVFVPMLVCVKSNGLNILFALQTWSLRCLDSFFFLSSPQVLKGSKKLCLSVRSVGRIPGGYVTNHVYTWVDPQGRSVSPPPDLPEHRSATLRRNDSQRRSNMQLLQEGDEKKVRAKQRTSVFRDTFFTLKLTLGVSSKD